VRVTDRLIFDTATRDTGRAREAAERAQEIVSSGTRIEHPSDGPAAAGMIVAFNMSSERFGAISKASAAASGELAAADGALDSVGTALSRARELAVQFSSSGYPQAQATGAATEVQGLLDQVISSLNTRYGNRYIFGGTQDGAPPFDSSGNYAGNAEARNVEIAPGVLEQANVLVGGMSADAGGLLKTLSDLRDALRSNYTPGAVQATLDGLDQGIDAVAVARSQAGVSMNAFDTATSTAQLASSDNQVRANQQGDVDLVEASIQLQATQTALEASFSATAQSFKLSLLDYLS
jgi:flagellar hook-associated protein 3 FlgL